MIIVEDEIQFDNCGRMKYHPEFHFAHGQPFTEEEMEYICKYHEVDDLLSLSFAIGRTSTTIARKLNELKKAGKYDHYKKLNKHWQEEMK